jgi:hypothetical protein
MSLFLESLPVIWHENIGKKDAFAATTESSSTKSLSATATPIFSPKKGKKEI